MKFWEAIKAIEEGKSVRRTDWVSKKLHINRENLKNAEILSEDEEYVLKNRITPHDFLEEWELYQQPVKKWKWVVKQGGTTMITDSYYSEKEIKDYPSKNVVKLPWTEKEFEE